MTDPTNPPVIFDYNAWIAAYPIFSGINEPEAQTYFDLADSYFANSVSNPALRNGVPRMTTLMYLVTSHLAWLLSARDANGNPSSMGQPSAPLVGRISTASEGSVSVGVELKDSGTPSEAFFTQTKWGFAFWQATAQYRNAFSVPNPTFVPSSIFPLYPRRIGWR